MKSLIKIFTVLVLSCFFLPNGCTGLPRNTATGGDPEGPLYQKAVQEESILLYPDRKDRSPRMSFQFTLLDASGPRNQKQFFRDVLYQGDSPEKYKEKILRRYEREYLEMYTAAEPEADFPRDSLNWFYIETMERDKIAPQAVVVRRTRDYYTGGAHGMRETEYFVLDLITMKRLSLEDTISPGSTPALKAEVETALRDRAGLGPEKPLSQGIYFEDTVDPSRNFFLNSQGMGFHWDPYEITPYSEGSIEIIIPYNKIMKFLSPQALALIAS
ncbi:MAG: RsiV family protein [Treponema sp.]|nr:RsiV family protein [Treponema sp.]